MSLSLQNIKILVNCYIFLLEVKPIVLESTRVVGCIKVIGIVQLLRADAFSKQTFA